MMCLYDNCFGSINLIFRRYGNCFQMTWPETECYLQHFSRAEGNPANQLTLCQNVLRAIQTVAKDGKNLNRETWESLLKFVLNVSDTLLAPPSSPSKYAKELLGLDVSTIFLLTNMRNNLYIILTKFEISTASRFEIVRFIFPLKRHAVLPVENYLSNNCITFKNVLIAELMPE